MSEEQTAPVEQVAEQQQLSIGSNSELEKLKADNEAMRRKNAELLKEYKTWVTEGDNY